MNISEGRTDGALLFLAQSGHLHSREQTSNSGSAQTLTVAAPGEGLVLMPNSVRAYYSNGASHTVTVSYTGHQGTARTFTIRTGGSSGSNKFDFDPPADGGLLTEPNTKIDIDAPAETGETSTVRILYAVVEEEIAKCVCA